ncbi:DUF3618 domain-containing protein [Mycobacterium frederiksbergense]|uniref:DUF3618 domain-containing protein n=1 Tax=Mycolicibacterium frederiksbergense TaxID=117567 RepID=UPI0021F2C2CF|nr:DUF3618 domain-containing protein [Mycolicibacterium frederiksbergense]MCV7044558.1 DUF3618 domain-containing protein [Mycolicibacterium frederiksbergense]
MAAPEPRPQPARGAGVDDITDDIEHTRQEVGETVAALTDKLDVKARVTDAVADKKGSLTAPVAAALAVGVVLLGVIVWRRRQGGTR